MRPDRVRRIEPPFGWIPFGILTSGLFEQLSPAAKLLYFFLCLVADSRGISFYGDRRLRVLLGLSTREIEHARGELYRRDLLAFTGALLWHDSPSLAAVHRYSWSGWYEIGLLGAYGAGVAVLAMLVLMPAIRTVTSPHRRGFWSLRKSLVIAWFTKLRSTGC